MLIIAVLKSLYSNSTTAWSSLVWFYCQLYIMTADCFLVNFDWMMDVVYRKTPKVNVTEKWAQGWWASCGMGHVWAFCCLACLHTPRLRVSLVPSHCLVLSVGPADRGFPHSQPHPLLWVDPACHCPVWATAASMWCWAHGGDSGILPSPGPEAVLGWHGCQGVSGGAPQVLLLPAEALFSSLPGRGLRLERVSCPSRRDKAFALTPLSGGLEGARRVPTQSQRLAVFPRPSHSISRLPAPPPAV